MANILVVGSSNTDMVVKTGRFPVPGETLLGGEFFMFAGGKGANQAVAAARLGGNVTFVAKVGDDVFGHEAIRGFKKEGMDITQVIIDKSNPSGVALILVNEQGQNEIVVASGANETLNKSDIDHAAHLLPESDIILVQLETPLDTVAYLMTQANRVKTPVILNPAPATKMTDATLDGLYLITPNETEAEILTGIKVSSLDMADRAAGNLLNKGIRHVIITMGASGSFYKGHNEMFFIKAKKVKALDTTGAGDIYNGALAVSLGEGKRFREAMQFATSAAAISVSRMGAQNSAPYLKELI